MIYLGIVKNNADPAQHGRLQVYIPSEDAVGVDFDGLPWASYASPFGGSTTDLKVGREAETVPGASTYGMWAIPKNGAQVAVFYANGDPKVRYWFACIFQPELNRTMPGGIDGYKSELDPNNAYPQQDTPHVVESLTEAGLDSSSPHFKTRGGFERSVSHPSNGNRNKPTDNGYASKPLEPEKADSQIYSINTPGRHFLAMSDVADHCRVRLKTTAGTQLLFDDTNERIYLSTAKGRNWIEIDETNGKIYLYTASKFSVHAENDINLYSDQNINIVAKKRVNIESEERGVKIQGKLNVETISTQGDVKLTASRSVHITTIDGPSGGAVAGSKTISQPPYAGKGLGVLKDHAEAAPSGTSGVFITGASSIDARTSGSLRLTSQDAFDLRSFSTFTYQGEEIRYQASSVLTPDATGGVFGGSATVASSASPGSASTTKVEMIVPAHEPWVRDEDEAACPTPRNKSFQG